MLYASSTGKATASTDRSCQDHKEWTGCSQKGPFADTNGNSRVDEKVSGENDLCHKPHSTVHVRVHVRIRAKPVTNAVSRFSLKKEQKRQDSCREG